MTARATYTHGPDSLEQELAALDPRARRALAERLGLLLATVTGAPAPSLSEAVEQVPAVIGSAPDLLWLASAVLDAELPTDEDMGEMLVRARLGGTWAALTPHLRRLAAEERFRKVEIIRGGVTCDVHTTAQSAFLSGIQRVVRETTSRWEQEHDLEFVGWTKERTALRRLTENEYDGMFGHFAPSGHDVGLPPSVIPWESTHLWVEVVTDPRRVGRLHAMAQYSRNEVAVLGYDSIPVTSAVTVADGMTAAFTRALSAVRYADRVAMISPAAAEEFRGWVDMGAGRRGAGPAVTAVSLAVASGTPTDADLEEARAGLVTDGLPMVLVVGSHEPRKNHLAVLHAAELLWRQGLRFSMVFVGAGSWNATDYETTVNGLIGAGRPIQSIRGLPDRLLWAAYRLAHCTLFPSLNEGFGLPVAESLAAGTPVITSGFGSMRDIVAPKGVPLGGLLVDPRDDESVVAALRAMLSDEELHRRLVEETAQHPERTWDQYAEELWSFLVAGHAAERSSAG
jgi:glycosyltransferase involved in cell wall biosynthesis